MLRVRPPARPDVQSFHKMLTAYCRHHTVAIAWLLPQLAYQLFVSLLLKCPWHGTGVPEPSPANPYLPNSSEQVITITYGLGFRVGENDNTEYWQQPADRM